MKVDFYRSSKIDKVNTVPASQGALHTPLSLAKSHAKLQLFNLIVMLSELKL